ncbi:cold shock CspA family protein [Kineococcus radiotolerans]|uniref:Cold shock CspA family protein n=1 Tax=Kineococcus radiotolerans TaxID=131568 RepID=A0A7W4TM60_KINRA|nr:cold shock domain-containing protein [Kineococcus radiotolerans]MBB2901017.1 cold shock CspA family protein [Kineococcus radiotolerans]
MVLVASLAKGKVRSFDDGRGFGFITSPDCPENVFFHVKDVVDLEAEDLEGASVQFTLDQGDRGYKATDVRPLGSAGRGPSRDAGRDSGRDAGRDAGRDRAGAGGRPTARGGALPVEQFRREVTELLLSAVDDLSGRQVRELRDALTDYGFDRGFLVDGR